ncbi:hypothetical protein CHGG_03090 [Chaetomium globosum CBS 148.51]|uniref:FHA domain-containing protein n=1 Tax=Chaetomium globosum (strain ATCC 6205 / CBS 148.51 / DSM 1962 / NBRC 6347 / NRRL 1970) TaxID=306901 RepID=Q2H9L4_CHAGB|nr:uncharacterized protein CHGG_03090 [Chaetomium globosum CBS 148.51]EAQ91155.1 hypothetical protein CHGG_03090 [Chaetomium globosum CBS 148.51]
MFTQPTVSRRPTSTGPGNLVVSPVTAAPASSTPPTRGSRLRGLTYLRNYTQTHILSREHSAHNNTHAPAVSNPQPATSAPSPPTISTNPWFTSGFTSARHDHSTTTPALDNNDSSNINNDNNNNYNPTSSSTRTNRFSHLVPTLGQPLRRSPDSSNERGPSGPATGISSELRAADAPPIPFPSSKNGSRIADGNRQTTGEMTRARSATTGDALTRHDGGGGLDTLPSIRFSTFVDPRATRPSLKFGPISRTLPSGREVIRVGRYSERDSQPNIPVNAPSAAPVGFKSKVVSRRHCEFWYEEGKWYIKDVKSSSGTFLNHIRLSPPGTESKPYPVNDGDIVQLGIDFKGGEEMIFRCVKMRLELNRGWQNKLNTFNIAPCQCLFVAPCSHTWHYKCIRSLLSSPSFPIFICPNCRAAADLEAEVEDPEEWEQLSDEGAVAPQGALLQPPLVDPNSQNSNSPSAPRKSRESVRSTRLFAAQQQQQLQPAEDSNMDLLMSSSPPRQESPPQLDGAVTLADPNLLSHTLSTPMPIPSPAQRTLPNGRRETRTPSPTGAPVANGHEGPITPRNDAGPWVFDGSGVRLSSESARPAGAALSQGGEVPASSIEAAVQAAGARLVRENDDP